MTTILTALYLDVLRPTDRVAVKPHSGPVFHAIQYLLGNQSPERLEWFRGFQGAQSYPSRTKDPVDVDFSTGSMGLGIAQTLFASLVQDYVRGKCWTKNSEAGRMIALAGDSELDEGNVFEALYEGWNTVCEMSDGSSTITARAWMLLSPTVCSGRSKVCFR